MNDSINPAVWTQFENCADGGVGPFEFAAIKPGDGQGSVGAGLVAECPIGSCRVAKGLDGLSGIVLGDRGLAR